MPHASPYKNHIINILYILGAEIAQLAQRMATGFTTEGSEFELQ
jgi:hypothetical protein